MPKALTGVSQAAGFTAAMCMVDPISISAAAGLTIFRSGWPPVAIFVMASPPTGKKGALARGDGRHARMLKAIARVDVLILDDWGLAVLTSSERRDLLEILEDRHGRGSTIVTSQLPVEHWHEAIGDPTMADAILDRLVHNAHRLQLAGESMRRRAAKPLDLSPQP